MLSCTYWPTLFTTIDEKALWLRSISQSIWEHPEIGHQEFFACKKLCSSLQELQFDVQTGIASMETAFIAKYQSTREGPTIAFVAEYDALPNLGHGCGHNLFCCAALGSALALKPLVEELGGGIVVLGAPAEEGVVPNFGGKVTLVKKGYFKNVDVAFTSHGENETVIERDLVSSLSPEIAFHGIAAHAGGSPEKGVNALTASLCTMNNINSMRQHNLPGDVINGIIKEGGTLANTIPDEARLALSLRASSYSGVLRILDLVQRCTKAAAIVTGCSYDFFKPENIYKDTKSNHELGLALAEVLKFLKVPFKQHDQRGYAWDAGNISYEVPTLASYFKIGNENIVCHTEAFKQAANSDEGYNGMITSAKGMAAVACEFLINHDFRERVSREFLLTRKNDS